jgi:hypothetical protein
MSTLPVKYKTHRVAARNLKVGTVTYRDGEIVSISPHPTSGYGIGCVYTFLGGHEEFYLYNDRVRIYLYL